MNTRQSNQYETLEDTHGFLSTTPAIGTLAAMPPKVARLGNQLEKIHVAAQVQSLPLRFAVHERDGAADSAIALTLVVGAALRSYAATNNLPELRAQASAASRRQFGELRRARRMELAQQVLAAAQPLVAELAGYGVTPAMLEDLEAKIAAGDAVVLSPRRASARRKAATRALGRHFAEAFKLLRDEIDPLVETLQLSDPATYAAYQDARSVFDRPGVRSAADDDAQPAANDGATVAAPATPPTQATQASPLAA